MRDLLDSGFAVVTPDALSRLAYWQTNVNRYAVADLSVWDESEDHGFVEELLRRAEEGSFGEVNMERVSAIGFSSGGYMTSRMAVNYRHRFKAFVVVGGAYFYCSGSCTNDVADAVAPHVWELHGPTLFLANSNDGTVPASTSEMYHRRLLQSGVEETRRAVQSGGGHAWPRESAAEITRWLETHG